MELSSAEKHLLDVGSEDYTELSYAIVALRREGDIAEELMIERARTTIRRLYHSGLIELYYVYDEQRERSRLLNAEEIAIELPSRVHWIVTRRGQSFYVALFSTAEGARLAYS